MPLILTNASVKLDGAELACSANHVELSPDINITTLDTFCGSRDYPGTVKWSLILTLYQSFDAGGPEEVLSAAVLGGVPVAFEIAGYRDVAAGTATNPSWAGEVIPQPYSPINGDAGDASTIELEWSVVGEPLKTPAPVLRDAPTAAQSAKK
jgi:hypothetical protein